MTDKNKPYAPPRRTMAAPNSSQISATIVQISAVATVPGKWQLDIEIIAFKPMSGGTFAHIGDVVSCFTFEAMDQFGVGDTIAAQGEFIGGAQSGVYQLRSLVRL